MRLSRRNLTLMSICSLLVLLLAACGGDETSLAATRAVTPEAIQLDIVSPLETGSLSGGWDLRIELSLVDQDARPVEGAFVRAELWHPDGELHADLACEDRGGGRYLTGVVRLPVRDGSGSWRITARATMPDDLSAEIRASFDVDPSISEIYQLRHGFWIEFPRIFGLGTGFTNLHTTGGLHFEDWLNADGSGYVILDNYRYVALGVTFATLEVHWLDQDYPGDAASAVAAASALVSTGLHHQEPDVPLTGLMAESTTFQGRPAWFVHGRGSEFYVSPAGGAYPIEWMIFTCPDSSWLWLLVLAADDVDYLDHLRNMRSTFECPEVQIQ